MPGPSIHDLLGLPAEVNKPNAYQVFGLTLGEADRQVIRSAIEIRVISLKEAKSSADPHVWAQAARAIQAAKNVLSDAEQKATLDAQYGIVNELEAAAVAPIDPLAALLPGTASSGQPTSAVPPPAPNVAISVQQSLPVPTETHVHPEATIPSVVPILQPASAQSTAPSIATRRPIRRRRSKGTWILGSLIVLLLGSLVGGLAYVYQGGGVQFVQNQNGFQIKTGGGDEPSTEKARIASPRPQPPTPRGDGIMNVPPPIRSGASNVSSDPRNNAAPTPPRDSMGGLNSMGNPNSMDSMSGEMNGSMPAGMPDTMTPEPATPEPEMTPPTPEPTAPEPPTPDPPTPEPSAPEPSTPPATPEAIAQGEAAIASARAAILTRQWGTMKSLAETAESQAVTPPQEQTAETLFQFVDLATYYQGAIGRAMGDLVAGNEIELAGSLTFLVQSCSADQITLFRNKREYPYTFDELPLVVIDALTAFQLDLSSPEGQAARAVYQSISSKSTPGHRTESSEILRSLGPVKGADPKRLADFIDSL